MKPLRLRAGVEWEQGLLGSAPWEGIPLARGALRPLKGGERPKLINKELWQRAAGEAPRPLSFSSTSHAYHSRRTARVHLTFPLARNSLNFLVTKPVTPRSAAFCLR